MPEKKEHNKILKYTVYVRAGTGEGEKKIQQGQEQVHEKEGLVSDFDLEGRGR